KIAQVSQETGSRVAAVGQEVTRLAQTYGVSAKELADVAITFKQAGLSLDDTSRALEAVAKSALAPNFDSLAETAEGAIAVFRQFNVSAAGLEDALGSINAVAGDFAVESRDLIEAIRKTGGAFAAAGGDLNELLAVFTSVRSATREGASEIATGLRTIFTRVQREDTVEALKRIGVQLRFTRAEAAAAGDLGLENQFVGAYEAVRRLSQGLSSLRTTDPRYSSIVEELGGYRQVSRVIPLIQQAGEAQRAYNVAQAGGLSLTASAEKAQDSLANRMAKLREQTAALFREIESSDAFQTMAKTALSLASAMETLVRQLAPAVPLLLAVGGVKAAQGAGQFFQNVKAGAIGGRRFASGGPVPGEGNRDTVPAWMTPGEFVIKQDSARKLGRAKLDFMNETGALPPRGYAAGGPVSREGRSVAEALRDRELGESAGRPVSPLDDASLLMHPLDWDRHRVSARRAAKIKAMGGMLRMGRGYARGGAIRRYDDEAALFADRVRDDGDAIASIVRYTSNDYLGVNEMLRTSEEDERGMPPQLASWMKSLRSNRRIRGIVEGLDRATSETISRPMIVYRGISGVDPARALGVGPGDIGKEARPDPGFMSTSARADHSHVRDADTKLRILLPAGTRGAALAQYSSVPREKEVLLPRSTPLSFLGIGDGFYNFRAGTPRFASGGPNTDSVLAMLTPKEYVINREAAARIGVAKLNYMNEKGEIPGFAKGGMVGVRGYAGGGPVRPPDPRLIAYGDAESVGRQLKDLGLTANQLNKIAAGMIESLGRIPQAFDRFRVSFGVSRRGSLVPSVVPAGLPPGVERPSSFFGEEEEPGITPAEGARRAIAEARRIGKPARPQGKEYSLEREIEILTRRTEGMSEDNPLRQPLADRLAKITQEYEAILDRRMAKVRDARPKMGIEDVAARVREGFLAEGAVETVDGKGKPGYRAPKEPEDTLAIEATRAARRPAAPLAGRVRRPEPSPALSPEEIYGAASSSGLIPGSADQNRPRRPGYAAESAATADRSLIAIARELAASFRGAAVPGDVAAKVKEIAAEIGSAGAGSGPPTPPVASGGLPPFGDRPSGPAGAFAGRGRAAAGSAFVGSQAFPIDVRGFDVTTGLPVGGTPFPRGPRGFAARGPSEPLPGVFASQTSWGIVRTAPSATTADFQAASDARGFRIPALRTGSEGSGRELALRQGGDIVLLSELQRQRRVAAGEFVGPPAPERAPSGPDYLFTGFSTTARHAGREIVPYRRPGGLALYRPFDEYDRRNPAEAAYQRGVLSDVGPPRPPRPPFGPGDDPLAFRSSVLDAVRAAASTAEADAAVARARGSGVTESLARRAAFEVTGGERDALGGTLLAGASRQGEFGRRLGPRADYGANSDRLGVVGATESEIARGTTFGRLVDRDFARRAREAGGESRISTQTRDDLLLASRQRVFDDLVKAETRNLRAIEKSISATEARRVAEERVAEALKKSNAGVVRDAGGATLGLAESVRSLRERGIKVGPDRLERLSESILGEDGFFDRARKDRERRAARNPNLGVVAAGAAYAASFAGQFLSDSAGSAEDAVAGRREGRFGLARG
ncbi:MAG: phage tail tape measure protein, partial [Thermoleophilia bacterium]|nr:phage tail tape measure protein [Thermoleophilia bacterium]